MCCRAPIRWRWGWMRSRPAGWGPGRSSAHRGSVIGALRLWAIGVGRDLATAFRAKRTFESGAALELRLGPADYSQFGTRRSIEHREVLEQVAIGVVEVDRRGGHPADQAGLVRRPLEERQRFHAERTKRCWRGQHIVKRYVERDMQSHGHRRGPDRP